MRLTSTESEETIKTYEQIASQYNDFTAEFWDKFPLETITTFAQAIPEPKRTLDVGSGPGRDAEILRNHGLTVTCLDAALAMVRLTRAKGFYSVKGIL